MRLLFLFIGELMSQPISNVSRVPKSITIGLMVFSVVLSLAGFVLLPVDERPLSVIAIVFGVYVLLIPLAFVIGSQIMARVTKDQIDWFNALSLGYLVSCVAMLWKMGTGV
jgi:hypothetical protein